MAEVMSDAEYITRLEAERDALRARLTELAETLEGVLGSFEAYTYLSDPPADENMTEYDYMMRPAWERAAALAAEGAGRDGAARREAYAQKPAWGASEEDIEHE